MEDIAELSQYGRKVLLIYAGYRSYMSISTFDVLRQGGLIDHGFPSHTSEYTQPLYLTIFGPFKKVFSSSFQRRAINRSSLVYEVFISAVSSFYF